MSSRWSPWPTAGEEGKKRQCDTVKYSYIHSQCITRLCMPLIFTRCVLRSMITLCFVLEFALGSPHKSGCAPTKTWSSSVTALAVDRVYFVVVYIYPMFWVIYIYPICCVVCMWFIMTKQLSTKQLYYFYPICCGVLFTPCVMHGLYFFTMGNVVYIYCMRYAWSIC